MSSSASHCNSLSTRITVLVRREVFVTTAICPHTTYGLLKAIRSHEISSPSVQETVGVGRPNACNQCHIDQTLSWSATWLDDWYGIQPPANLSADDRRYSSTLLAALTGDAGQRALAAWSLGWQPALEASRHDWATPVLGQLLNDPYHAVRFIAARSLKSQVGFQDFDFDFVGDDSYRAQKSADVFNTWTNNKGERQDDASLLMSPGGTLDLREFERLSKLRDDRPVVLAE